MSEIEIELAKKVEEFEELKRQYNKLCKSMYWYLSFTANTALWLKHLTPEKAALRSAALYYLLRRKLKEQGQLEFLEKEEEILEPVILNTIDKRNNPKDPTAMSIILSARSVMDKMN